MKPKVGDTVIFQVPITREKKMAVVTEATAN